jgi:hypothetical protein
MSGLERISDKDLAEWVKQVEDDTPSKEKAASKPKPPEQAPKPNGQGDNPPRNAHAGPEA